MSVNRRYYCRDMLRDRRDELMKTKEVWEEIALLYAATDPHEVQLDSRGKPHLKNRRIAFVNNFKANVRLFLLVDVVWRSTVRT
jgi:hypothetical protein